MSLVEHPAFAAFALCSAFLAFKMMLLGHYTGFLRIGKKSFLNPEDAKAFAQMSETVAAEHPGVDRGLRAHRNDLESTLPFFAIGIIYLLTNPSEGMAKGLIYSFTALRTIFTVFYMTGLQPWRSLTFLAAEICLIVMLVQIVMSVLS